MSRLLDAFGRRGMQRKGANAERQLSEVAGLGHMMKNYMTVIWMDGALL